MRRILVLFASFAIGGWCLAVSNGDSLASVLAEKGEPKSRLERGNLVMLTYDDLVIRLEDGRVVSQKGASADYAVKTDPAKRARVPSAQTFRPALRSGGWGTDVEAAVAAARGTGRKVFVLFTGSDWCVWCQRLESEVLATPEFQSYAGGSLVLVKLDFPRRSPQPEALTEQNRRQASRYRVKGFPTVIVLDEEGTAVARLGYQEGGPGPFVQRLRQL